MLKQIVVLAAVASLGMGCAVADPWGPNIGAKATYQITRRWNANVGVSGGFGQYGHTAVAAGVGCTFGN